MKKSFFDLLDTKGMTYHDHPNDEPCPGYPHCYRVYVSLNALADGLMQATVNFANAKIDHPKQIHSYFGGAFTPASTPRLKEVRATQRKLKEWLTLDDLSEDKMPLVGSGSAFTAVSDSAGYAELADKSPANAHIVAEPFTAKLGGLANLLPKKKLKQTAGHGLSIEFTYRFVHASLDDLVTIGAAFIVQHGLTSKIGLCAREGCGTFFIDKKSRGNPRKYCKTEQCEKIIKSETTARSRDKARKAKRSKK